MDDLFAEAIASKTEGTRVIPNWKDSPPLNPKLRSTIKLLIMDLRRSRVGLRCWFGLLAERSCLGLGRSGIKWWSMTSKLVKKWWHRSKKSSANQSKRPGPVSTTSSRTSTRK